MAQAHERVKPQPSIISAHALLPGAQVYFYKPPTQAEVINRTRMAKHLAHYHGPAKIIGPVANKKRQYELEYSGKTYKRDISMLVPQAQMPAKYEDRTDLDLTQALET